MGKLKFLLARIAGLNWKQMFRKIDEVHEKSGRSKLFIFFDMVWCGLRYQAGYMDYWLFEMYDLNAAQRKTVLTRGINNGFIKAYNDPAYMPEIENKLKFAHNFSEFLHRDWLDYSTASDAELDAFIEKHPVFMVKPVDGQCGRGIEKLDVRELTEPVREHLDGAGKVLLEECVVQHRDLMALHPCSVNTCRVISFTHGKKTRVVAAYLRIGNGKYVDNFNNGGMVVPIEEDRGEIIYPALDKSGHLYDVHPLTGVPIKGFKIPLWDEVIALVERAGQVVRRVAGGIGLAQRLGAEGADGLRGLTDESVPVLREAAIRLREPDVQPRRIERKARRGQRRGEKHARVFEHQRAQGQRALAGKQRARALTEQLHIRPHAGVEPDGHGALEYLHIQRRVRKRRRRVADEEQYRHVAQARLIERLRGKRQKRRRGGRRAGSLRRHGLRRNRRDERNIGKRRNAHAAYPPKTVISTACAFF